MNLFQAPSLDVCRSYTSRNLFNFPARNGHSEDIGCHTAQARSSRRKPSDTPMLLRLLIGPEDSCALSHAPYHWQQRPQAYTIPACHGTLACLRQTATSYACNHQGNIRCERGGRERDERETPALCLPGLCHAKHIAGHCPCPALNFDLMPDAAMMNLRTGCGNFSQS